MTISKTAPIRKKLDTVFDDSGLSAFCFDYFPQVHGKFSQGMRKDDKISLLLDYCRRHPTGFQKLLEYVRKEYTDSGKMSDFQNEELKPLIDILSEYVKGLPQTNKTTKDASGSQNGTDPSHMPGTDKKKIIPIWIWILGLLLVMVVLIGGVTSFMKLVVSEPPATQTATQAPSTSTSPESGADEEGEEPPFECPSEMVLMAEAKICIDRYEVTNQAYQACVSTTRCSIPDKSTSVTRLNEGEYYGNSTYDNYPVIRVTWYQAKAYCEFADKRLPTPSEWEQAADYTADYTWRELDEITKYDDTEAVGTTGDKSPAGVYNLADNVSEWVDGVDERKASEKLVKGYSFYSQPTDLQTRLPSKPDWGVGFRCVKE